MSRILVTGDKGFIGRELTRSLEADGHEVIGYDLANGLDIRDAIKVLDIFDIYDPDSVIHMAGQVDVGFGENHPYLDAETNITGTLNILEAMITMDVRDITFVSSQAIFGSLENPYPYTNYGISKQASENYVRKYVRDDKISGRIARFSSVYGYGRERFGEPAGPINSFLRQGIDTGIIKVWGTGHTTRNCIHVSDATRALKQVHTEGVDSANSYNIGLKSSVQINTLANYVAQLTGAEVRHIEIDTGGTPEILFSSFPCISIYREFNFQPQYDLWSGIRKTYEEMIK